MVAWPSPSSAWRLCPLLTASASPSQALKMLAIASSSESPPLVTGRDSAHPLFDAQMTREIFASIDSATRPGSESLLLTVPAAVTLMLNTEGSGHPPPLSKVLLSPKPSALLPKSHVLPINPPHVVTTGWYIGDPL